MEHSVDEESNVAEQEQEQQQQPQPSATRTGFTNLYSVHSDSLTLNRLFALAYFIVGITKFYLAPT